MRLIDADVFKENMDYICDAGGWLEPVTKAVREFVKRHIDAQTTVKPEQQWIPCRERLPEEDVYVLISKKPSPISGSKFSVTIGMRYINRRSKKAEWRDSGFGYLSDDKVLAWMPLPSPYQEEGEQDE